jgi:hypothetical protein
VADPRFWDAFHDGTIVSVSGSVPGDLEFIIECDHLYEELSHGQGTFRFKITDCDFFQFKSFKDDVTHDEVDALNRAEAEILSAEFDNGIMSVFIHEGLMVLRYQGQSVAMDSGWVVSLEQLCEASDRSVQSTEPDL